MGNTITVKAIWEFEVDTEGLDEKFVNVTGLAKELTQRELETVLQKRELSAEDFTYEVEEKE